MKNTYASNHFYMEREWRKYAYMNFEPDEITRIVVAKGYKEQAEIDFPMYSDRIFEIG